MDFKSMLQQLSQLSEATKETEKGRIHKADPGGYGRKFDTDEEGDENKDDKKKEPAVKRGRGRPKKGADSETGQVAKYDNAKALQSFMVGNLPKGKLPGKPGKKHTLKDWVEQIEAEYVAEAAPGQQLTVKPMPGAAQLVDPSTQRVMATGDAAAVKNIQGAVAQGKVQMRGPGPQEMAEEGDYSAKKARAGKDIGKPGKQFSKIAKSAGERYGSKAAGERVAGAVLKNLRKADEGVSEASKKIPASNKPVKPEDLYVSLKDIPAKKPRGHTQYDPAKEFPGVKAFKKQGVAEGYSLKKTNVEKTFHPGDPEDYGSVDMTRKDTDYEIINNKTGQVVGTASWTTNDYFGPGALKITMKNGATRWIDIWEREKGNPQSAFNRFVKDPKTAKKYKEQGVAEASNGLYQKAIRKYAQQVANDYLGGGDEHLYGANKFDAEMFGVSREQANKDFKTLFNIIVRAQAVKQRQGMKESDTAEKKKNPWNEGYWAGHRQEDRDCPYPPESSAAEFWELGYYQGNKDRKDEMTGRVIEADIPSDQMDMGAGLGAGRSSKTFESTKAKPDFLDLDKDKNRKESMKDAAAHAKQGKKKKMNESSHRHSAARLMGKSHALAKEGYNCRYEDMDEAREYHEGFKEGLDECYGQGVYEMAPSTPPMTMGGMANQAMPAMEDDMEEGNAFTAALARTPRGGEFSVGGRSFTDRSGYDAKLDELAFESLDNQLNALLNEDAVAEGMTVSISKGQQGMPDSVTVSAQDNEADALLGLIKQAGLGLFGDDQPNGYEASDGDQVTSHGDIKVVGDHDGMMSLIKKVSGGSQGDSEDYADEEGHEGHDHAEDEVCDDCGSADCQCDEKVDEVESYDQEEEQVAENNPPDSDAAETTADENAEAEEDMALAATNEGGDGSEASEEGEEQVTEWANDAGKRAEDFDDESFNTDIDFITKVISGGLNKPKSTGQTTVPVVASQHDRMVTHESIADWKKLAGL